MADHLMTVEGIYDGKAIRPLGKIKTRKRHRVLITFLEKVRPVVIVSIESYNRYAGDVVVCGVTSKLKPMRFAIQIDQQKRIS
ncbi:MAG: type II toxin-antitoxin system PemK/MazF family toxin [candidate division KSB1 bacterium]|nr:type II toxin-antitoxin system PemK/MazF family toxin [candidate division KSB1 bacterium]MDZ7368501.1 type II toxin-antitoxin system PemK/MazF family toxin [candidate division KSB1 bacterium]MDZ7406271.1 type II toxin-antitoxin system PemK/MazF family toxin [candidate division KSB1 bacterium]